MEIPRRRAILRETTGDPDDLDLREHLADLIKEVEATLAGPTHDVYYPGGDGRRERQIVVDKLREALMWAAQR